MAKNFDWTEDQNVPGVIINPGTGPVHNTSEEDARKNIDTFIEDVRKEHKIDPDIEVGVISKGAQDDGRYTYLLTANGHKVDVDMPGLPVEQVRWMKLPDQNIWDFPRLYVDGSSWVWFYAVSQASRLAWPEGAWVCGECFEEQPPAVTQVDGMCPTCVAQAPTQGGGAE